MLKFKNFILKYKFQIILIVIFVASAISIFIQDKERKDSIMINSSSIKSKEGKIGVYISGEVKKEGVYYLDKDARVTNLIDIAGGLTTEADISNINRAKEIKNHELIIIKNINDKTTEDEVIEDSISEEVIDDTLISINNSDIEQLKEIPGIGEVKAKAIISYRESNGEFRSIDELKNVDGIGEKTFEKIKDNIKL